MLLFISTLILPIILGIISYFFFRDRTTNNELMALFGVSIVSFIIMFFSMRLYNVDDIRYHSKQITSLRFYEEWNEYVKKTCSRTVCSGSGKNRSCVTHYYDCSYVRTHDDMWVKRDKNNNEYDITKEEYNKILKIWGGEKTFVDMHRRYHTKDGDAYQSNWDGDIATTEIVNSSEHYENRTLTSHTIFNHQSYDEKTAIEKGLFNYPKLNKHSTIINNTKISEETIKKYNYLNTLSKEYRIYFIYFKNKDRKIAFEQKRHWQGGNDNEIVVCVGLNGNDEVMWVEPFSWARNPIIETKIKSFYASTNGLNLENLYPYITDWLKKDWKKRDFHDFDYIDIELTGKQVIWLWIFLSIINIGFTVYIVLNEFERKK